MLLTRLNEAVLGRGGWACAKMWFHGDSNLLGSSWKLGKKWLLSIVLALSPGTGLASLLCLCSPWWLAILEGLGEEKRAWLGLSFCWFWPGLWAAVQRTSGVGLLGSRPGSSLLWDFCPHLRPLLRRLCSRSPGLSWSLSLPLLITHALHSVGLRFLTCLCAASSDSFCLFAASGTLQDTLGASSPAVLVCFSVAVTKHWPKTNWEREGWQVSLSLREVRTETQGLPQPRNKTQEECCSGLYP